MNLRGEAGRAFTAAEAERRVRQWYDRGLILFTLWAPGAPWHQASVAYPPGATWNAAHDRAVQAWTLAGSAVHS